MAWVRTADGTLIPTENISLMVKMEATKGGDWWYQVQTRDGKTFKASPETVFDAEHDLRQCSWWR